MSNIDSKRSPSDMSYVVAADMTLSESSRRRLHGMYIPGLTKWRGKIVKRLNRWRDRWRTSRKPSHIRLRGIRVAIDRARFSEKIIRRLYDGGYEREECVALERTLRADDRLLELGAGIGYISTAAARRIGSTRVVTVEANDALAPIIEATHRANNVTPERRFGVMTASNDLSPRVFYRHTRNLWSSSLTLPDGPYEQVQVPAMSWAETLSELRPSYLVMDIEGGEIELLSCLDADHVRRMLIEFHPRKTGTESVAGVFEHLHRLGFRADRVASGTHIYYFER
ncbi:FkbM family methyltransferase [uncultured Salinisphaera sp.]|uniref:FkbM family methyltransferase n=1 Tax=uncultured Salinisphaera sp. TaxID=359372 RepID=UPI0032B30D3A|tara:strand:+ start:4418 stop:5266 length:849 start_codon:yes stop_codon:yes gene_type:complete